MEYVEGKPINTINADGLRVSVSLGKGKHLLAEVSVVNDTSRPVTIFATQSELELLHPVDKRFQPKDPYKMAASIGRNQRIQSAVDEAAAGMQQRRQTTTTTSTGQATVYGDVNATATYNGQSQTTSTSPDWQARRAASIRSLQRAQQAQSEMQWIVSTALKNHTLRPGEAISGLLWFDWNRAMGKPGAQIELTVVVDRLLFVFPFVRN